MIALGSFLGVIGLVAFGSLVGRHLRRARKQQTRPVLYVVYDKRLDIREAKRRSR